MVAFLKEFLILIHTAASYILYIRTATPENVSFGIYAQLGVFWINNDAKFLHAEDEDSDQTLRMHRLI